MSETLTQEDALLLFDLAHARFPHWRRDRVLFTMWFASSCRDWDALFNYLASGAPMNREVRQLYEDMKQGLLKEGVTDLELAARHLAWLEQRASSLTSHAAPARTPAPLGPWQQGN